jgi:hypothetical protein
MSSFNTAVPSADYVQEVMFTLIKADINDNIPG